MAPETSEKRWNAKDAEEYWINNQGGVPEK
jgi:hypothetical protein